MDAVRAAVAGAMAGAPATLYVGFSGGRDSTVLLHAVAAARRAGVVAVHVHHGLHPQADHWQAHCETFAAGLGVGFLARRVSVSRGGSFEARARAARYRVFTDLLATPEAWLFLAHHRHDQSETVLLRLLQGRGLYGMPPRRPLAAGVLVRPLLDLAPPRLEVYARDHALSWVEDPGNADERLDRNFLRHRVLPPLRRRWPGVDGALLEAMDGHRLAEQRLTAPFGDLAATGSLAVAALEHRHPAEAVELVRLWLQAHGLPVPRRNALRELLRQAASGAGRRPLLHLAGTAVACHAGRLHLVAPQPDLEPPYGVALPGITRLPHGELEVRADPSGFCASGAVEVRFRQGGERLAAGGHHRTLKQLLQEARVPPWERATLPLLFDAEGLLAVPGVAARDPGQASGPRWRAAWRPHPPARSHDSPSPGRGSPDGP